MLLIVTPGASSLVDDVLPARFGLGDLLAQPLPGPSADDPPLLAAELSPRLPVVVSPDDVLAGLEVDDSDEDVPVVSAAATP
ncbi:hypothetical protein CQY21_28985 [Mycolicibacterium boenickei]|nr:hypothetical protein CQY21_28985 [Mycolicibacterium boenickei]